MSIWAHHCDELEGYMEDIVRQRIDSGEFFILFADGMVDLLTHGDVDNTFHICSLLEEKIGSSYCFDVMDEAMQTFIDRRFMAAEAAVELQMDWEAEHG